MLESYKTISQEGQKEIIIKGSRFICSLKRVTDEEDAKAFIQSVKKEHWKATHNCSAYLIGDTNHIQRAHDDGEPSGTAGVPMLEILKKNDLRYVAAVVTRYFGGTKLGAGGLIRAYGKSVSSALRSIGLVERSLQIPLVCTVSYSASGKLENYLLQSTYPLIDTIYTDTVSFKVGVKTAEVEQFQAELIDLMNGQITFEAEDVQYVEQAVSQQIEEDSDEDDED
ncbi:YigZ family protein [Jeotgalibaca sp. PTS2502]|uniref:YigZ family protein n=1 Tax=Jeotgalibaca sp. PTS2502 TaxID=1903686 RepID=UPI0009735CFE|nr:YigZ family protein [Jeotgalibaca sp. PTS2502]APZ49437.1 YigZ family protein [Jeotgalibaca sp. PTS2502]